MGAERNPKDYAGDQERELTRSRGCVRGLSDIFYDGARHVGRHTAHELGQCFVGALVLHRHEGFDGGDVGAVKLLRHVHHMGVGRHAGSNERRQRAPRGASEAKPGVSHAEHCLFPCFVREPAAKAKPTAHAHEREAPTGTTQATDKGGGAVRWVRPGGYG